MAIMNGGIASEQRRSLPVVTYTGKAGLVSLDLPKDTCIKRIEIRLKGQHDVTYASGSPIGAPQGFMGRWLSGGISVVANGSRYVKAVDPYLLRCEQHIITGFSPERSYSSSASAPTTFIGQTEMPFGAAEVIPATTQFVVANETVTIFFENQFAYNFGAQASLFNTRGLSSCVMNFNFTDISNIQRDETSPVAVTYGNINLSLSVVLVESPDVDTDARFLDYKQTFKRVQFSSQTSAGAIDLPRGNLLCGLSILVNDGDANKTLSDKALTLIELRANGSRVLQASSFLDLQQSYRASKGVYAPKGTASASVTHALQGFAFMNLLKNGDIRTALDSKSFDQLQLLCTTAASTGVDAATYTNPVTVTVQTHELAQV